MFCRCSHCGADSAQSDRRLRGFVRILAILGLCASAALRQARKVLPESSHEQVGNDEWRDQRSAICMLASIDKVGQPGLLVSVGVAVALNPWLPFSSSWNV